MNNFTYITPSDLLDKHPDCTSSLDKLIAISQEPDSDCDCGEPVWKYGQSGMCFSCTTGEADASDDYELLRES